MPAPPPLPPNPYNVSFFDRKKLLPIWFINDSRWAFLSVHLLTDEISMDFLACYWTYCGGGTCTKSTTYEHICQCNPGYTNLMNISVFPCFNDCKDRTFKRLFSVWLGANFCFRFYSSTNEGAVCLCEGAIGSDCSKLGIKVADSTSSPGSNDSHGESKFDIFFSSASWNIWKRSTRPLLHFWQLMFLCLQHLLHYPGSYSQWPYWQPPWLCFSGSKMNRSVSVYSHCFLYQQHTGFDHRVPFSLFWFITVYFSLLQSILV